LRRLLRVRARSDIELHIRRWESELAEKLIGHGIVVMLAGVQQHFLMRRAQRAADCCGLDELRPRPNDSENLQASSTS
jgi:hypothetical protein